MMPVPTDPMRNIRRMRDDESVDDGVESTDVDVILDYWTE